MVALTPEAVVRDNARLLSVPEIVTRLNQMVEDPDSEVSLIYHDSRLGLEERVTRLSSGKSASAVPLPRTTHFVGSVRASGDGEKIEAHASWQVMLYHPRTAQQHLLFGRYQHELVQRNGGWRIRRKKVSLLNDRLPTLLDFYCV